MQRDWKARWEANWTATQPRREGREPADRPDFTADTLQKHNTLRKHESSTLVQIRTGKIGLKAFLFQCGVPSENSPNCQCGERETAAHIILHCPLLAAQRNSLNKDLRRPLRTRRDFDEATAKDGPAQSIARWMLWIGRIREYRLAEGLLTAQLEEGD